MKLILLILCFGFIIISCKKSNEILYQQQGVLTGYDARECASPQCGGLLITIKNDTTKNPPPYYHINSTLAQLRIKESTKFPINVSLNFKPDTGIFAGYHYIIVTQIKIVN